MLELTVRLVASLAVVVGLMLLLARVVGRRYGARAGAPVQVLHRQALSRGASVTVISVGSRVLLVGATDQQVSLLTELDPDELADLETPGDPDGVAADEADEAGLTAVITEDLASAFAADVAPAPPVVAAAPSPSPRGAHRAVTPRAAASRSASRSAARSSMRASVADGALAGSVLSPQTWRQALAAATGKAS
ncbi:flagellar biosynthetic protein FliO [Nocardioides KLBMP 9356]|uniref:Flagellar biosynthetic protein FliO n=1 Tax=Nocardioides potassii TaxID=2911371 RepID=A0ABS9HD40_9ACTN|nr:flagellar biosynthetic protein FliO [Nocardioides potassii]MCF6378226.1 flagellar biosynthetic protein FliO [Nocardioides potassii]